VALFVSCITQMTDGAFVERVGLLQAGHAAHRECYPAAIRCVQ
jgi:hypothetical protein